jgi:2,3-bisphosphoglycerate-dependent phosphoglycerate mutase
MIGRLSPGDSSCRSGGSGNAAVRPPPRRVPGTSAWDTSADSVGLVAIADDHPGPAGGLCTLGPILVMRHGTSEANLEGRVAGWQDTPLAPEGESDARLAADRIHSAGLVPDTVYASRLMRAKRTADIVSTALGLPSGYVHTTWRLNERHAGAFEGLTRDEMMVRFGRDPVRAWKRGIDVPPVPMERDDPRHPVHDSRYDDVPRELLPSGESAAQVLARVLPFWNTEVHGDLAAKRTVLIVTHDRVLRVLLGYLSDTGAPPFDDGPGRVPWAVTLRADDHTLAGCAAVGPPPR